MLFALVCTDKPGNLQVRIDNRPVHVDVRPRTWTFNKPEAK